MIHDRIANKWPADFEKEKIGWSLVTLETFRNDNIV